MNVESNTFRIELRSAKLCMELDCNTIFDARMYRHCPTCSSVESYPLEAWLNRERSRRAARVPFHAEGALKTAPRSRWLDRVAVPVAHLDALDREPRSSDLVIVPEVIAAQGARLPFRWRRIVFVQGSFLIPGGLEGAADYRALGYERALAVLPHVAAVVDRHFGVSASVVPPFVAPYFFRDGAEIARGQRRKIVLFVMKPEYRRVGFPDYDIFMRLTRERFADRAGRAAGDAGWRLVELDGSLSHALVAELMSEASFLVNLNSHEAFNTTVPEAMAAGCIPICYDAFGGQDFLNDGENAFVFPNHHVYPLVEKLLALTADGADGPTLRSMRLRARASAARDRLFPPG